VTDYYYCTLDETVNAVVRKASSALGYHHLKDKRIEAACSVLSGEYTFLALPAGYSKSIYVLLPKAFDILKRN